MSNLRGSPCPACGTLLDRGMACPICPDPEWERALNSAAYQLETYARQGKLATPEERRVALNDALQHAVGLLKLMRSSQEIRK